MTLNLFESHHLPTNETARRIPWPQRQLSDILWILKYKFILPTRDVGNVPHTTTEEDLVAVDPRSDHLTD